MDHTDATQLFLDTCHLIHAKGLVSGSGGNISLACDDGILITPSGRSLESLKKEDLVLLQMNGSYTCANGGIPSKEWRMHLACYRVRSDIRALVHVHSSNAVAVACMKDVDPACAIPVYTPGYSMRVGELPLLPYMKPGSIELCEHVSPLIAERNSVLLANHGPLAVGRSMEEALNIIEEIEDEAKLFLLLGDHGVTMTKAQQDALPTHGLRF